MQQSLIGLLGPDDPEPVLVENEGGASPFLLVGDHAGAAIPAALGDLGVSAADRARHIAIDIGVAALGRALAGRLDAPFIHQRYSRLVIDCNRDPARPDAMPAASDGTPIAANAALNDVARNARVAAIHTPYHQAIAAMLDARAAAGRETILIALHSFTPAMGGVARPWQVGVLHHQGDLRFARALLAVLHHDETLTVGDNQPYQMDQIDYTVPRHAWPRGLRYAEIEVRQDLIADAAGVAEWCGRAASAFESARLAC